IPQRYRAFRRDGLFERPVRVGEHGHVRQFREERVDRIVEAQRAVLALFFTSGWSGLRTSAYVLKVATGHHLNYFPRVK
ncbi:MAG TPA: hypothetical protein VNO54_13805, partial [Streptosporangiaceae bacterium]|nr:hypothetical protein [Streptosporangiaceae bacterium]